MRYIHKKAELTINGLKLMLFDWMWLNASQNVFEGRWHSSCKTVSSSIKRRSKQSLGFVGVAGQSLYLSNVTAGSSHLQNWTLHTCCLPDIKYKM